jgi:hypothetical protein
MELMTIGAFAERTRLSAKALRLHDQLGLLVPAQVDPVNGYRLYDEGQAGHARTAGMVGQYWAQVASPRERFAQC